MNTIISGSLRARRNILLEVLFLKHIITQRQEEDCLIKTVQVALLKTTLSKEHMVTVKGPLKHPGHNHFDLHPVAFNQAVLFSVMSILSL